MTLLAPFGFYGWGNIGDESTLQGFARLVERQDRGLRVWVASQNPKHTARVEPSFKYFQAGMDGLKAHWARRTSRAQIIAGGTPIMDNLGPWPLSELVPIVRHAEKAKQPIACVGVGVENLRQQSSRDLVSQELAPRVRHWSVRSARDRDRLIELNVPSERITVAADMAWLLAPVNTDFGRRTLKALGIAGEGGNYIGVNVNYERAMAAEQPNFLPLMAEALDGLIGDLRARVLFLCNEVRDGETFDKATAREVLARMKRASQATIVPNDYFTPQQMLSLIGCCRLTISSRYHFCLFSALQGVPFLALERSDKVADLCWDLQWTQRMGLKDLSAECVGQFGRDLLRRASSHSRLLAEGTERMRNRARTNHVALAAVSWN